MGIYCRHWNSISDGDGNQLVNHYVQHNSLALHSPLLESIPFEVCWHGCNATSSAVVTLHKSRRSLLGHLFYIYVALSVRVPYTIGIFNDGSYQ